MPFGQIELQKWQLLLDKEHLVQAIRDFSVQVGVDLVIEKTDARRYTTLCANADCNWRVHAAVLPDKVTWVIKTLNSPHTCHRLEHNPMASIKWLAGKILNVVRANFKVPCKSLLEIFMARFGINVPLSTMYKARAEAVKQVQGSHDESYGMLPHYICMIRDKNADAFAFIVG